MSFEREHIGACTLYRGDAAEVLPTLKPMDALVTDPPWGIDVGKANNPMRNSGYGRHLGKKAYLSYDDTYDNFCQLIVPRVNVALDQTRCGAVFSGPHIHEQRKPTAIGGIYHPQNGGRTAWGTKNFLPVLFYGLPPGAGQHRPTVIWQVSCPEPSLHPCAKPLAYMQWLVRLASRPDECILDLFMGSGTTGVACVQLGRAFVGIEIEPCYFDHACRRIEQAYAQPDLFLPMPQPRVQQEVLFA